MAMALSVSSRGALGLLANTSYKSLRCPTIRGIAGKALKVKVDKPKPFPYETREFNYFWYVFGYDRTTLRFDENTKLIVVDGSHAVGKSKFAKELAEELEMKYMPQVDMDMIYKSPYGHLDLRDYNEFYMPRNRSYDEKDFARNPLGPVEGCADRLHFHQYALKYKQYLLALRHIFNTGQGVVLEQSPYSHHVQVNAAHHAGWIDKSSMPFFNKLYEYTLHFLLRPNLIIYLDAPVDTVQKKIKTRGNEWDKNSPVWSNSQYLSDIYTTMKREYLKNAKGHSQVLVYDWSEPGETDVVVEDIERLNFDYYGQYEDQQKDWRMYNDEQCTIFRYRYSRKSSVMKMVSSLCKPIEPDAKHMYLTVDESYNQQHVGDWLPGHNYDVGYNSDMGDSYMWKVDHYPTYVQPWFYNFFGTTRQVPWVNNHDFVPK